MVIRLAIAIAVVADSIMGGIRACLLLQVSPSGCSVSLSPVRSRSTLPRRGLPRAESAMPALRVLAIFFLVLAFSAHAAVAAAVGMVTKVENQAQVGGATAVVGSLVNTNDELRTGPKSRMEVTFRDKTTVTLGENARLVVDRYVFNPEQSTGELVVSTGVGAFRMATGRLSEMRDKKINVSAPFAALAVRGTDFWWGPIYDHSGTLLVSNSKVVVANDRDRCPPDEQRRGRCLCAVTLTQSGQGTEIKPECPEGQRSNDRRCWSCPGAPTFWSPAQVSAALSQTQFGLALGPGLAVPAAAAAGVGAAAAVSAAANHQKKLPPQAKPQPASP
jgi:FecR protein